MKIKIPNTLRYSSIKISFQLNPFQWQWIPTHFIGKLNEWPDENVFQVHVSWIFIALRVYIDDGSW